MNLTALSLEHKDIFDSYLSLEKHRLCVYSFENIYLWKAMYEITWCLLEESLLVFFQDSQGTFLYLPPLGKRIEKKTLEILFTYLQKNNSHASAIRIENLEAQHISLYEKMGYTVSEKMGDYLCASKELGTLSGKKLKSKRGACNHFVKYYPTYVYRPYEPADLSACLALQESWIQNRKATHEDRIYADMLLDSQTCLRFLLPIVAHLNLVGRVVTLDEKIIAFTFGYPLHEEIFCILYEVTDLRIQGLAPFIFREFCREHQKYPYINIMDDSGLPNLQKIKLSYRPIEYVRAYIVTPS